MEGKTQSAQQQQQQQQQQQEGVGSQSNFFHRLKRVNLLFSIPYNTAWGESLVLSVSHLQSSSSSSSSSSSPSSSASSSSWDDIELSPKHTQRGQLLWVGSLPHVPLPSPSPSPHNLHRPIPLLTYRYRVVDYDSRRILRSEAGPPHSLSLAFDCPDSSLVEIHDLWQDASAPENFLCKSPFQEVIFQHKTDGLYKDLSYSMPSNISSFNGVTIQFKIRCPRLEPKKGQKVYLVSGSGNSETEVLLSSAGDICWMGDCVVDGMEFPLIYKYMIKDENKVIIEEGSERELFVDASTSQPGIMIVDDGYFKESPWRGAGLAVPVFSLRSNDGVGVGEFLDIKLLVDFSVKCGLHLIQLLPVNDTSVNGMWWDSYPYSSLSVFALHPLYLRLQQLSKSLPQAIMEEIENAKEELDLKEVDYEATLSTKLLIAKKIFQLEKDQVLESLEYKSYFSENQDWLKPYAAFCFLRDLFGTSDHSQWGLYSSFSQAKLEKLVDPTTEHFGAVAFHYYLQYHLHLQLSEAANYATSHRVLLKGDLPIGVDRNSVDTWMNPTLFRMNASTGAPPDYFDKNGQNWGFPTYNWEEMSKDNYGWWRDRLKQMSKYFSAYRIDHVLGFFRIWELPDHAATGLMGRFRPSIPLSQEELEKEGIWDFNRLIKPYVRRYMLEERFGERWTEIAQSYFIESGDVCYGFKEKYNTEKKIVKQLGMSETVCGYDVKFMKAQLIDLLQEVVLLQDSEDSAKFYPRFNLEQTSSFKDLDDWSKHVLRRLYYDYYFHRQEELWKENALKTLPVLLNSSNMMACGEDLGMVPACVHPVLRDLGLLGLRIQRMPSNPGVEFALPSDYEYATVCAPSCHDSSTLRAWWEEDEGRRVRFFHNVLYFGDMPPSKCEPSVVYAIIRQHMESPSMWAVFPIQDLLALKEVYARRPAEEECINDPTNPKHYWRFRLHVLLDSLVDDTELSNEIRGLVEHNGRVAPPVESTATVISKDVGHSISSSQGRTGKPIHFIKVSGHENGLTNAFSNHGTNGQHIECDA